VLRDCSERRRRTAEVGVAFFFARAHVQSRPGPFTLTFHRRRQRSAHPGRRCHRGKLLDQACRARGPGVSVDLDQPFDDFAKRRRDLGFNLFQRPPVAIQNPLHDLDVVRSIERTNARHGFEKHDAERE
jgi:hypothetical protein